MAKKHKIMVDPENARIHDERNQEAIGQSLRDLGTGRSILIDSDNVIIGGNGVYAQAKELGLPVRVIESDGTELIAVKRTDLKSSDAKRKALAIADNRTNDLSFFDDEKLGELLGECDDLISAAGFTSEEIAKMEHLTGVLNDLEENAFGNNIKAIADVFSITFVFPKTTGQPVTDFIEKKGKNTLTEHLIAYCRKAVK